jgi:hypothetical protein
MSASVGMLGSARAQYHLRQMFVFLNMHPVNVSEVIATFASDKFDSDGNLLDKNAKRFLTLLLQNLSNWTRRLRENKTSSVYVFISPRFVLSITIRKTIPIFHINAIILALQLFYNINST